MRKELRRMLAETLENIEAEQERLRKELKDGQPDESDADFEDWDATAKEKRLSALAGWWYRATNFPASDEDVCVPCYVQDGRTLILKAISAIQPNADRFECPVCRVGISVIP